MSFIPLLLCKISKNGQTSLTSLLRKSRLADFADYFESAHKSVQKFFIVIV